MFRSLKLVGVMLVLVILSVPLLAAVTCFTGAPAAMQMHCAAGCPMMASADMVPAAQLMAQHSSGPCCNISSHRPLPVAVVQQRVVLSSAVQPISSSTPMPAPAIVRTPGEQPKAVRFPDSPQALLCVFLI